MNTSQLKRFAQEARRKLLEQVGAKLNFVLTTDSAELREKAEQLKQLRQELGRTTKEQLIEKVAYTWFNRLMALRFMDVNDYQPMGIRIITPKDGYTIPELLDEAKRGNIPEELKVNRQKIYDLLDNKIPSSNPQNEAFRELLISACNHLHTTFPFLFEKINDYTELLLPDDLTSDFSIIKGVRDGILIEDCKNVEIIGWLYQFYISEKKDEVFASKSKVKKEDIPAATQLFTPRWIVEYMVQNTLGKLWLQNRPKSRLREHMPYFIESAALELEDFLKINSPEEIKFLDPASGSGHILIYAFDLFTKIYEEEGYNTNEIPKLIIENNLYGFEIDERAAQLSGLALLIKAREHNRRAFRSILKPNILYFKDSQLSSQETKEVFNVWNINYSNELLHDLSLLHHATNFGSIIIPHSGLSEIERITKILTSNIKSSDVFQHNKIEEIIISLNQLELLALRFHCVVTNPPYMGFGNMNNELSEFVKSNYPTSKTDLMSCFMERALNMLSPTGFLGMINQQSWMFLGAHKKFREKIINSPVSVDTLLQLGANVFPEISGEVVQNVAFTFINSPENVGYYFRLIESDDSISKRDCLVEYIKSNNYNKRTFSDFQGIPENIMGYWLSKTQLEYLINKPNFENYGSTREGLTTANNDAYLRFFWEVNFDKLNSSSKSNPKWFTYQKGGLYRKWYGNNEIVINWEDDGVLIKNNIDLKTGRIRSHNYNGEYALKEGITWTAFSGSTISARYSNNDFFDSRGPKYFPKTNLDYFLGLLNSKIATAYLEVFSPAIDIKPGHISKLPVLLDSVTSIEKLVKECIIIAKMDFDSYETSIDFKCNNLLNLKQEQSDTIEEAYQSFIQYWTIKFIRLHNIETILNKQFIGIYDLSKEVSPSVPLREITLLQDELDRRKLERLNKTLSFNSETFCIEHNQEINLPFICSETISHLLSYAIACMFGRYSLYKEGLILANQGETLEEYLHKIEKTAHECAYLPDSDNIIPVLEDEWFEDDIVSKFYHFLKVTFGEKNFNKNLAFIEEQIGKDIRKYFIKDFYPDHIKRYKKRPIYWMFSSPKGSFNVLIYIHRYTPDTVGNILNKYLKEFIGKLNTRKEHLQNVQVTGSASDKTKAIKESDNIQRMLVELHEYERDILYPLATERIEIDLDDGVLVNYNKFGKAVKEVNGLNDPATKKKVKQFDWIDTSQIR